MLIKRFYSHTVLSSTTYHEYFWNNFISLNFSTHESGASFSHAAYMWSILMHLNVQQPLVANGKPHQEVSENLISSICIKTSLKKEELI